MPVYLDECLTDDCSTCYDTAVRFNKCTICELPLLSWDVLSDARRAQRHKSCQKRYSYYRHRYYQRIRYREGTVSPQQRAEIHERALKETQRDESLMESLKLYISSELVRFHRDGHGTRW